MELACILIIPLGVNVLHARFIWLNVLPFFFGPPCFFWFCVKGAANHFKKQKSKSIVYFPGKKREAVY